MSPRSTKETIQPPDKHQFKPSQSRSTQFSSQTLESNAKNHQPTCHLLVQAVEEECDVVLEAGDGSRDSGPAGSEPGVRRSGVEAVGVGESGARHGARGALDLPRDLERATNNPAT
jgi:hypothetical protein